MLIPSSVLSALMKGSEFAKSIQRNMFDCLDVGFDKVKDGKRFHKFCKLYGEFDDGRVETNLSNRKRDVTTLQLVP